MAFENWCNRTAKYQIKLTSTEIIFGIYHDNKSYKNMNYVILHAKWCKQLYLKRKIYTHCIKWLPLLSNLSKAEVCNILTAVSDAFEYMVSMIDEEYLHIIFNVMYFDPTCCPTSQFHATSSFMAPYSH